MRPDLAFNTAVSFMTNTSWQSYAGETALSYFSQMAGVAVQSFTSAAAGLAVAVALIRAFCRADAAYIGNFWVDRRAARSMCCFRFRSSAPCSCARRAWFRHSRLLVMPQRWMRETRRFPWGRWRRRNVNRLSSDGGGFYNANSSHPFENPTPLTNLIEMLLMLAGPAGMTYAFGRMVADQRQGWTLFGVMIVLFAAGGIAVTLAEARRPNPARRRRRAWQLEGKETRLGVAGSALFSVAATASSDGAVNSSHDSFTPLAGWYSSST